MNVPGKQNVLPETEAEALDEEIFCEETDDNLWAYEEEIKALLKANEGYIAEFAEDLEQSGLKDATIRRHLSNANLFLNGWLTPREGFSMEEGIENLDRFLGDYYIRRCLWSKPANIKTTAASLKKFYKSMADHGRIAEADYKYLVQSIKEEMPEWQRKCALYNDPNIAWDEIAGEFGLFY